MEFPWTKRDIIEAVIAECKPFDIDDPTSWAFYTAFRAFERLALGRREGRTAPRVEHALWTRIGRVWEALCAGRDPGVAFETPLDDEEPFTADVDNEEPLTTDVQIADAKSLARLLDEVDRELRTARRGRAA
jgi:hypothetical protein